MVTVIDAETGEQLMELQHVHLEVGDMFDVDAFGKGCRFEVVERQVDLRSRGVLTAPDEIIRARRVGPPADAVLADLARAVRQAFPERAETILSTVEGWRRRAESGALEALAVIVAHHDNRFRRCQQCGYANEHRPDCFVTPAIRALEKAGRSDLLPRGDRPAGITVPLSEELLDTLPAARQARLVMEEAARTGDSLAFNPETGMVRRQRPGDERAFVTMNDLEAGAEVVHVELPFAQFDQLGAGVAAVRTGNAVAVPFAADHDWVATEGGERCSVCGGARATAEIFGLSQCPGRPSSRTS